MSRILPLPADAHSQIRSSKHITSLEGVVFSLLMNSLDAGSTKVEISIDFHRGGCVIEDNGSGIPPCEFTDGGGLGKMYHTSKQTAAVTACEVHGSTGTYLASLAALSLFSVTSRHADHVDTAMLAIHRGKVIARRLPATHEQEFTLSQEHGTRVTVNDLFGNMPVRVKQRALAANTGIGGERAWQELKRGIVALLLAWHSPCAVRIRGVDNDRRRLSLSPQHPALSAALTAKSLDKLSGKATKFDLNDMLPLLHQASLASLESRREWIPVSTAVSKLYVKGAICLEPAPTRQCQFISIGIHPCSAVLGHHALYDSINKVFTNSSFGALEDDVDGDAIEKDRRKHDRRYKNDGYTQKQLHGRKCVDRWPMFVLQVKFRDGQQSPRTNADAISDASLMAIAEILEATVNQWLAANNFRPRKPRRRKNEEQQGPAVASKSERSSPAGPRRPGFQRTDPTIPAGGPSTADIVSTAKKRKFNDLALLHTVGSENRPATVPVRKGDFSTWSRIKSGKDSFYDEMWQSHKFPASPGQRSGSRTLPARTPTPTTFALPSLDAGALSKSNHVSAPVPGNAVVNTAASRMFPASRPQLALSSEDFGSVDERDMLDAAASIEISHRETASSEEQVNENAEAEFPNDLILDWIDPVTKRTFQVNARTGVVFPSRPKSQSHKTDLFTTPDTSTRQSAAINTTLTSAGRCLSLEKRQRTGATDGGTQWLPGFLKDWNNPVFPRQDEQKIPVASIEGPGVDAAECDGRTCTHDHRTKIFTEAGSASTSKLSKGALRRARVIGQVDQKFIICKTGGSDVDGSGEVVLLVDQHAASERVILEQLLTELCAPGDVPFGPSQSMAKTVHLDKPLRFQIPAAEHQLFHDYSSHFAGWGIVYDVVTKEETMTASQVRLPKQENTIIITALPPGIAERCALIPRILIDMLRAEIWTLQETTSARGISAKPRDSTAASMREVNGDERDQSWLQRIGRCPKGILEMLYSRACRSAIMFNDELSIAECENLIEELSRCAFPFMCAHGRVSMVPLVDLADNGLNAGGAALRACPIGSLSVEDESDGRGFMHTFKRWEMVRSNSGDTLSS
ncbi:DNA mismatch repair protein [Vermiconidia calcicola]|uniref:DNA mismatch repair protein n=1 Tax=Vermiconidia calcicola TaxID=1690605 RepID=A0ACC3N6I8_9PEZI|nr:DNA mismatch repair protein [Vermiconidia calcicola]